MKQYIVALMLACSIQGHSQDVKQATFVPPFDFTLSLEIEPSMKMVSPDFSEVAAQSQCKVKWRNKSSLLHIL